jgi:hypothetical protein
MPASASQCYYIGGSEHSATTMMRDISTPMKNGLPADRICEKLKPKNGAVCELQFGMRGV